MNVISYEDARYLMENEDDIEVFRLYENGSMSIIGSIEELDQADDDGAKFAIERSA